MENHERNSLEDQLADSGQLTITQARGMVIESQQDYENAGRFLVEIKTRSKQVKDYWAQPKAAAKAAHQTVVDREKEMLAPLVEAERVIKESMVNYQKAVEQAQRQAEEEARKRQQEEADRLLQQAVESAASGDEMGEAINLAMAEMVNEMPTAAAIAPAKAAGISTSKTWKARVIDETIVPAYVNGMEVRKINLAALNSIAKMTKGTANIPGVEFYQDMSISARS